MTFCLLYKVSLHPWNPNRSLHKTTFRCRSGHFTPECLLQIRKWLSSSLIPLSLWEMLYDDFFEASSCSVVCYRGQNFHGWVTWMVKDLGGWEEKGTTKETNNCDQCDKLKELARVVRALHKTSLSCGHKKFPGDPILCFVFWPSLGTFHWKVPRLFQNLEGTARNHAFGFLLPKSIYTGYFGK